MTLTDFKDSLSSNAPPATLSPPLQALWHDARGDWDRAHRIAQDINGPVGAWVHAYLHRKEGDLSNAGYWYRHAQRPAATGALDDEWSGIVQALLSETPEV